MKVIIIRRLLEQIGGSLKLDWDFSNTMTLTSITAYESAEDASLGDIDGGNPAGPGFIPFSVGNP